MNRQEFMKRYQSLKSFIVRREQPYAFADVPSLTVEVYDGEGYYDNGYYDETLGVSLETYLKKFDGETYQLRERVSHYVIDFDNNDIDFTTTSYGVLE